VNPPASEHGIGCFFELATMIARYGKLLARLGISLRDLENFESLVLAMGDDVDLEELKDYHSKIESIQKNASDFGLEQSAIQPSIIKGT
jgi:hypothetical protein